MTGHPDMENEGRYYNSTWQRGSSHVWSKLNLKIIRVKINLLNLLTPPQLKDTPRILSRSV
jgi:hypothetical protein